MDIPNLSNNSINLPQKSLQLPNKTPIYIYPIIIIVAVIIGFGASRIFPSRTQNEISNQTNSIETKATKIIEGEEIKPGILYGNTNKTFADGAAGIIKSGGINGEGTHTLEREGGKTQNAALTSSVIDLDLFIDKKVEVKGETNKSNKVGWLLDVGSIKIIE